VLKKASLCLYALVLTGLVLWQAIQISASRHSDGKRVPIQLKRDTLTLLQFPSKTTETQAIVIFASGDGGWDGLEEAISHSLQNQGYEVIGFDCYAYAKTDYDLDTLQADFTTIAQNAETPYGQHPPPLILGGWSMGAAQAIAAAGGPHPPPGLAGLLLVDPCSRGRYGLRVSDRLDMSPTGPGTFNMEEFSRTMGKLRIVQWHADEDSIDSRAWLESLTAPHREFDFPKTGHYYNNDSENFLRELVESVGWILDPSPDDLKLNASVKADP
jgi:pimeloyl-ACP methyl ester carboxylesterase